MLERKLFLHFTNKVVVNNRKEQMYKIFFSEIGQMKKFYFIRIKTNNFCSVANIICFLNYQTFQLVPKYSFLLMDTIAVTAS